MKGLLLTLLTPTALVQAQVRSVAPEAVNALPALNASPLTTIELQGNSPLGLLQTGPLEGLGSLQGLEAGPSSLGSLGSLGAAYEAEANAGALPGMDSHAAMFDGTLGAPALPALAAADEAAVPLPGMSWNDAPAGSLGKMYPRIAVIADVLDGAASDEFVHHIDVLQQKGVQVVFLTDRPSHGKNSVDEVLTSRLKGRRDNSLIIVSEGGSKIYKLSGKSANPKPVIPNVDPFSEAEWTAISNVVERAGVKLKNRVQLPARPEKEAFTYSFKAKDAASFALQASRALKRAGLPYRAEARGGEVQISVIRRHLAVPRMVQALQAVTHRDLFTNPREALILADTKKHAALLSALPKGVFVHAVQDANTLHGALKAVLGSDSLEKVSVERNKIRSFLEHISKDERHFGGGGGGGWSGNTGTINRDLAFYKGIVMYELMGRLYRDLRNGQYQLASLDRAESRLKSMWRHPKKNWVRVPKQIEKAMYSKAWHAQQRGAMESAIGWLRNYYARRFPDYPNGVLEGVVQTLANLASDGKSLITVELRSPYTGRKYLVHVRPARAELLKGMNGPELLATAYRFGKEKPGEQDDVEAKLLALAMLKGYASRSNGQFVVNGKPVDIVRVNFEYTMRSISKSFRISELAQAENELTSLIERMEADKAFLAKYEKEKEAAKPSVKNKKKPAAKKPASKKPAAKTTKAARGAK